MSSEKVIALSPIGTGVGVWLLLLSFYCDGSRAAALDLLALVALSMTLGALIVAYPQVR